MRLNLLHSLSTALDGVTANINNNTIPTQPYTQGNSLNNTGNPILSAIIYIVVIGVIIAVLLYLRKFILKKNSAAKNGAYMKLIDNLVITQDKQVVMIELDKKIIIAGVTPSQINTLDIIDKTELKSLPQDDSTTGVFGNMLIDRMQKRAETKQENGK